MHYYYFIIIIIFCDDLNLLDSLPHKYNNTFHLEMIYILFINGILDNYHYLLVSSTANSTEIETSHLYNYSKLLKFNSFVKWKGCNFTF